MVIGIVIKTKFHRKAHEKKDTLSRLKAEERKIRQQIIIDAAREVFGQKTYDKASMAEIAKTAGIAKSSIYTYFKSQEELYATIVHTDACRFIEDLQAKIDKAPDAALKTSISLFSGLLYPPYLPSGE